MLGEPFGSELAGVCTALFPPRRMPCPRVRQYARVGAAGGDRLRERETVLEVAQTDAWQARIMVKGIGLPKVEIGQPARLYVNAFPHTEYKVFEGTVEEVSAVTVIGNAVAGAVYPIRMSIRDPQVWDGEQVYPLAYEMNGVVERGRVLELLWKKLLQTAEPVARHDFHRQESGEEEEGPSRKAIYK